MRTHLGTDNRTSDETTRGADAKTQPPSRPLALASVGICLVTGAAIALVALLA
jgi:hypothetical protein